MFYSDDPGGVTPGGFTPGAAKRIPFANSGGTGLTDSANFQWDDSLVALGIGAAPAAIGENSRVQVVDNSNTFVNLWANNNHVNGRAGFYATSNSGPGVFLKSFSVAAGATLGGDAIPLAGVAQLGSTGGNDFLVGTEAAKSLRLYTNGLVRLDMDSAGNVVVGRAALATSATDGFLYIPTCAGTPSGTPTAKTGRVPIIFDSTANKIWIYDGAWLQTVALT